MPMRYSKLFDGNFYRYVSNFSMIVFFFSSASHLSTTTYDMEISLHGYHDSWPSVYMGSLEYYNSRFHSDNSIKGHFVNVRKIYKTSLGIRLLSRWKNSRVNKDKRNRASKTFDVVLCNVWSAGTLQNSKRTYVSLNVRCCSATFWGCFATVRT
jgi:hypothetical protein